MGREVATDRLHLVAPIASVDQWPKKRLGELFEIARGGSPRPIDAFISDSPGSMPWISIRDASESPKYIERTKLKIRAEGVSRSRVVHDGDFLLTNSMSFGRPYISRITGCIHDGWLVLAPHDRSTVDQDYFYQLLGSPAVYSQFQQLAAGAVVKNLNIDIVAGVKVPVPPLAVQQSIAKILDKADAIRRKRKQAIALTDELLRSAFLEMFGDPVSNPKGWPVQALGTAFAEDPRIGTLRPAGEAGEQLVVRVGELGAYDIALHKCGRVSLSDEELGRFGLRTGDMVLARAIGSIDHLGKASVLQATDENVVFDSHVMRLRLNPTRLLPYFLLQWLRSLGGRHLFMKEAGRTAVQFNVNGKQIARVAIPLPPVEAQRNFVALFDKLRASRHLLAKSEEQLDRLWAALVGGAFGASRDRHDDRPGRRLAGEVHP